MKCVLPRLLPASFEVNFARILQFHFSFCSFFFGMKSTYTKYRKASQWENLAKSAITAKTQKICSKKLAALHLAGCGRWKVEGGRCRLGTSLCRSGHSF